MNDQISHWKMIKIFFQAYDFYRKLESEFKLHVTEPQKGRIKSFDSFIKYLDTKDLGYLRDFYLSELRHLSHAGFRSRKKIERFDLYISEIFHEFSILKEQRFILEHSLHNKEQITTETLTETLQQTYDLFQTKLNHVSVLFSNAKTRLEEILPTFRRDDFILRNLFLDGPTLLKDFYKKPVNEILNYMFQEGGFCKGLLAIASSFSQGGFYKQSLNVLQTIKKNDLKSLNEECLAVYEKLNGFLKKHIDDENTATTFQVFNSEIKPFLIGIDQN